MKIIYSLLILSLFYVQGHTQEIRTLLQWDTKSAATKIAINPEGDLILLGHRGASTDDAYYHRDGFIAKYTRSGDLLWQTDLNYSSAPHSSFSLDEKGNIYVVLDDGVFRLSKFDTDGALLWEKRILDLPGILFNTKPTAIAASKDYIYVGGEVFGKNYFEIDTLAHQSSGSDFWLAQFNQQGDLQWFKTIISSGGDFNDIVIDQNEDIVFSASPRISAQMEEIELRYPYQFSILGKLSPDGTLIWLDYCTGTETSSEVRSLAIDKHNHIYAAGIRFNSPYLTKFSPAGERIWEHHSPQQVFSVGRGVWNDIHLNDCGKIYLSGSMVGELEFDGEIQLSGTDGYGADFMFAEYQSNGKLRWIETVAGDKKDELYSLSSFRNTLFLAGYQDGVIGSQSIPFENYLSVLTYTDNSPATLDSYEKDINLFPNPNNGTFCLYFGEPSKGTIELQIYDALGRLVYQKQQQELLPTQPLIGLNVADLPNGYYVLQVVQGDKQKSIPFLIDQ